jgi:hypothetical protein
MYEQMQQSLSDVPNLAKCQSADRYELGQEACLKLQNRRYQGAQQAKYKKQTKIHEITKRCVEYKVLDINDARCITQMMEGKPNPLPTNKDTTSRRKDLKLQPN